MDARLATLYKTRHCITYRFYALPHHSVGSIVPETGVVDQFRGPLLVARRSVNYFSYSNFYQTWPVQGSVSIRWMERHEGGHPSNDYIQFGFLYNLHNNWDQ